MNKEKRIFETTMEIRSEGESPTLRGMAAIFDSSSEKMGFFTERIEAGAFDDIKEDDVRALFNHDPNLILGRTKSGTLRLNVTEAGLEYEIDLPDTTVARDLSKSVERGDVSQSSFAFTVGKDRWEKSGDDEIRVIERVNRLYDVSPVTYPAYPDTTVAKRSHEEWKADQPKALTQSQRMALQIEINRQ